jgi:hypothetical protein
MSERVISDPTVAGWELNPDTGYWMWAAGGGGSIQDGDTEGQITTWSGDEWTPEGAVVVDANGSVGINADGVVQSGDAPLKVYSEAGSQLVLAKNNGGAGISLGSKDTTYGLVEATAGGGLSLWAGDGSLNQALVIDADGNVDVAEGDLRVSSTTDTTTISLKNSVGEYEISNNQYGSIAINYNGEERFVLASNGDVYVEGRLFVSGEEVTAGGGASLWTDNGDGTISSAKTAKAPDFVTT